MMNSASADVSWLLSALAQASAALIAIVGGLLVSRYVSLHAEQQGAQRRVDDLARRADEAETRLRESREKLELFYVDDALDSHEVFEQILDDGFEPTVEAVLAVVDDSDLNRDLLAERLENLTEELRLAAEKLVDIVPIEQHHPEFDRFRRDHSLEIKHNSAWEWTYQVVCEERKEQWRESQRSQPGFAGLNTGYFDFAPPTSGLAAVAISSQHERDYVKSLRAAIDQAETDFRTLCQEGRLAEETYQAARQPEGFKLALQVLTFLAVAGMALPVILMSFGPTSLDPWVRMAVTVSFFAGVALLLRFLFVYASFLGKNGRPDLPRNALGLLRRHRRNRRVTAKRGTKLTRTAEH